MTRGRPRPRFLIKAKKEPLMAVLKELQMDVRSLARAMKITPQALYQAMRPGSPLGLSSSVANLLMIATESAKFDELLVIVSPKKKQPLYTTDKGIST